MRKSPEERRAVSVRQFFKTKIRTLDFDGNWLSAVGSPEASGVWIIWGNSGNGKTRFALQLAKYLAGMGCRVAYNSLEEGVSESFRLAMLDCNILEVSRRFVLLDKEPIADLISRLSKKKSPDVIIIDSIQYTGLTYNEYKNLKETFRGKMFILISHAEGSHPAGRVARSIRFDANVKIWVDGYTAYPKSRYGGGEPFVIWKEGALNHTLPKTNSNEDTPGSEQ